MDTFGDRLRRIRLEAGLSQEALAKRCGLTQGLIGHIENGRNESSKHLIAIAQALGVDPEYLATGIESKRPPSDHGHVVEYKQSLNKVPLLRMISAGHWKEAIDLESGSFGFSDYVATTIKTKKYTYAVRVTGDSMEPKFPDGCIIIVEPEEEARHGSYVIVRQNGSDATFKQLVIDGNARYLKPSNPRYPIMQMQPDAEICGVVKQMIMDI